MNLRTLVSAGMLVAAGMLASRVLGFLREAMIAANYGTGADANMIIGLLLIPDYITSILIGGALSAVLLPAFAARDAAQRLALFWQVMAGSVAIFMVLVLLVYSQADAIIHVLHGDIDEVSSAALFWALFSMPLAGASGVITAWLQYHSRFAIPAFANALFNLVIVLTLWLAPSGFTVLGLGIFVAGLTRLALFITGFTRSPAAQRPSRQPWQVDKRLLSHYAAAVGNSFFSLLPQYIPYLIITLLSGEMALFNYAFKLVLLPGMILNTIINVVMLPRFVHLRKEGRDVQEYGRSLRMGTSLALCITLAMSLASWHIVMLCFGYGEMTEADINEVTHIFAIGIWRS
ncbi:MAG: lipid II flippase MurJ, partial [Alphaproteobacteria bacterium]